MSTLPSQHDWSPEKLAAKNKAEVETLRQNALRQNASELVAMCEAELAARKPAKQKRVRLGGASRASDDIVAGYHFVCRRGRGVAEHKPGSFWTGSWVVAEANVAKSLQYNAYLALHESRGDLSYRQGRIIDYRRSARDMLTDQNDEGAKIDEGIEFLVREEPQAYRWVGRGAAEKGYQWSKMQSLAPRVNEGDSQP